MSFNKIVCLAALSASAITSFSYAGSAQAFTFKVTDGVYRDGVTNQGAFSEFYKDKGVTTIDFNNGKAPTDGFATYTFENGWRSSVRPDVWAPVGPNVETNTSNYLAVFKDDKVKISLKDSLNYFGIDLGALSSGNTFSFFKGDKQIASFNTDDFGQKLTTSAWQHGGQLNGYIHFYADQENESFDNIVIEQANYEGGGFETDNHSFYVGTGKFTGFDSQSVPEPSATLGMLAVGGMFLRKRKNQKLQSVKQSA